MVAIKCGKCGKELKAKPEWAGKRVKCAGCGSAVDVPTGAAPTSDAGAVERIAVQCGGCGEKFQAPANLAGKQLKCKKCGAAIVVPAKAAGAAKAPAA
jgi:DNA-directed RNA polymerase subunit RPC12/RpoP